MDPFTWFAVAFAAVFVASSLLIKIKPTDAAKAALKDFTFPRSNEGDPVNKVYGTVKLLSPNVIWTGAFLGKPFVKKVSTGLFSSKRVVQYYDYYIGMQLALCLGPNVRVRRIWFGKYLAWTGTLSGGGSAVINRLDLFGGPNKNGGVLGTVYFYDGDRPQTQDPFLAHHIGAGVPRYNGIAHLVFTENNVSMRGFYFGKSSQIETVAIEVDCFNNTLGIPGGKHIMSNGLDANPAEILYDMCTTEFAMLGIPTSQIDTASFLAAADTLYDENHFMSLQISSVAKGSELIAEILKQINGVLYQDTQTGKFVLGLQRQDYDKYALPEIDVDNLADISNYTRNLWADTINKVSVLFKNRDNNYMDNSPAVWQDPGNIAATGKVRASQINHPGCYDADLAVYLATRTGAALSVPLFSADIKVNRAVGQNLKPNDVFRLNCRRLGIKKLVMRVKDVDLGELDAGMVTVSAFQDIYASNVVVFGAPTGTQWEANDNEADPITAYAVIGAPYYFVKQADVPLVGVTENTGLVWALARKPSNASVQFSAYSSTDGFVSNTQMVDASQYSGAGLIEASYADTVALSDGFDNGGTGIVVYSLDGSYTPETSTDSDIQSLGANLALIGNEIIAYRTVTSLGGGRYRLTNIRRALFDTTFETHAADTPIFFLSSGDGLSDAAYDQDYAGDVRLTDLTTSSGYDLASAADIAFTMDKRTWRPSPPAYLTIGGTRQPATVTNSTSPAIAWRERNRLTDNVKFYDDAASTAEVGTDYVLRWRVDGGSWTTVDPFTSGSTITLGVTLGLLEVEVWSRRDGNLSRAVARGTSTVV